MGVFFRKCPWRGALYCDSVQVLVVGKELYSTIPHFLSRANSLLLRLLYYMCSGQVIKRAIKSAGQRLKETLEMTLGRPDRGPPMPAPGKGRQCARCVVFVLKALIMQVISVPAFYAPIDLWGNIILSFVSVAHISLSYCDLNPAISQLLYTTLSPCATLGTVCCWDHSIISPLDQPRTRGTRSRECLRLTNREIRY